MTTNLRDEYYNWVAGFASRYLRTDFEDAIEEIWREVDRLHHTFNLERGSLKWWIANVAASVCQRRSHERIRDFDSNRLPTELRHLIRDGSLKLSGVYGDTVEFSSAQRDSEGYVERRCEVNWGPGSCRAEVVDFDLGATTKFDFKSLSDLPDFLHKLAAGITI